MMKNPLFIYLETPVEVRRQVLEAAKSALTTLKSSTQFRQVREEKLQTAHSLKETMKELKGLNVHLKDLFPEMIVAEEKESKKVMVKKEKIHVEPLQVDKVEQLEQALHDIEMKLTKLG